MRPSRRGASHASGAARGRRGSPAGRRRKWQLEPADGRPERRRSEPRGLAVRACLGSAAAGRGGLPGRGAAAWRPQQARDMATARSAVVEGAWSELPCGADRSVVTAQVNEQMIQAWRTPNTAQPQWPRSTWNRRHGKCLLPD
jgi:hypothetical protein